ncbi:MAG: phosphate signaling complex protein PhoU [Phycisphaerales bacterium]|nr:phosphate signaling complex protein PhoU [Phycisphaerales bacterium]
MDYQSELLDLRRNLLSMGALVEQRVTRAIEAIVDHDLDAAQQVRKGDDEIDDMEVRIEQAAMRLLALGHPVAGDLRFILSVMRINSELERIGDLARGCAKRFMRLSNYESIPLPDALTDLAFAARTMLSDVLAALSNEDQALCQQVRRSDRRVDDLQRAVLVWAREEIPRHVSATAAAIEVLAIAQRFERIADIATNIAEDVIFVVAGRMVRHSRD